MNSRSLTHLCPSYILAFVTTRRGGVFVLHGPKSSPRLAEKKRTPRLWQSDDHWTMRKRPTTMKPKQSDFLPLLLLRDGD